ncbi:MAG: ChrR family anti-sigma-E factor [Gammaproteobacteria bacterium]|nr:ChrR family anti-sigma-E factor [Gammaproteobacteria bacterium]
MKFHPSPELLLRYSAGTLTPAMSFVVASHVQQCNICQSTQDNLEYMGGVSIENYADSTVNDASFDSLLNRLEDNPTSDQSNLNIPLATDYQSMFSDIVDKKYENVGWQSIAGKIDRAEVNVADGDNQVEILRFAPNAKIPQHTHKGNEYTVILEGSYTDELGEFGVGDFIHMNQNHHHRPVASKKGCVCIAVTDAPMHFTGVLGPVLNLFAR